MRKTIYAIYIEGTLEAPKYRHVCSNFALAEDFIMQRCRLLIDNEEYIDGMRFIKEPKMQRRSEFIRGEVVAGYELFGLDEDGEVIVVSKLWIESLSMKCVEEQAPIQINKMEFDPKKLELDPGLLFSIVDSLIDENHRDNAGHLHLIKDDDDE